MLAVLQYTNNYHVWYWLCMVIQGSTFSNKSYRRVESKTESWEESDKEPVSLSKQLSREIVLLKCCGRSLGATWDNSALNSWTVNIGQINTWSSSMDSQELGISTFKQMSLIRRIVSILIWMLILFLSSMVIQCFTTQQYELESGCT